jgi:hypothetical protein
MIAAFHIIDGQTLCIFVMRTSGKIAKASISEIGGLGDEAPDENVAVPLPAQKIREATCRCVEASSQKRLSHRRGENRRERHIQTDEKHLQLL